MRNNHLVTSCKVQNCCNNCSRRHHTTICQLENSINNSNGSDQSVDKVDSKSDDGLKTASAVAVQPCTNKTSFMSDTSVLPTASIHLVGPKQQSECGCLFDTGAQKTYILNSVAANLGCKTIGYKSLSIEGFNTSVARQSYPVYEISTLANGEVITFHAIGIDKLPEKISMPGRSRFVQQLQSRGITVANGSSGDLLPNLGMIVGVDNLFKFIVAERVSDSMYMLPSVFGNLLAGSIPQSHVSDTAVTTILHVGNRRDPHDVHLNSTLERFWDLDAIGIKDKSTLEGNAVIDDFESSISYGENRYEVALPWKQSHAQLYPNLNLAHSRLKTTVSKLIKDPERLHQYDKIIKDQLDAGFIEIVEDHGSVQTLGKVHYLSHHAISKDSSTTPLRVVFDCSAKSSKHSPSLNECLYSGPCLSNDLCSVLLRFRVGQHACTTDISKAFLQVGLREQDRDFTRFLWPKDPRDPNSEIITYRFKVVLFGATCSQFLLNATVLHHLRNIGGVTARDIQRNIYIDNVLNSFKSEGDMIQFYHMSKAIMEQAGFPLREWSSTSASLNELAESNEDYTKDGSVSKVLGLKWNTREDRLILKHVDYQGDVTTKRELVSEAAKLYDVLGLWLPVTIRSRLLIQDVWKLDVGWDENLPLDILNQWTALAADLTKLPSIEIPRNISVGNYVQLDVFVDASMAAYGAVAYITSGGSSSLILARARVAPIKKLTLPQLELMAATLGSRLVPYVVSAFSEEIKFDVVNLWTDSKIVLGWLETDKRVGQFVNNRVEEIKRNLVNVKIAHVNGVDNPADALTRGLSTHNLIAHDRWWHGPHWLRDQVDYALKRNQVLSCSVEASVELPSANVEGDVISAPPASESEQEQLVNVEGFGEMKRLLLFVSTLFFCSMTFSYKIGRTGEPSRISCLERARIYVIKKSQQQWYNEEYAYLVNNESGPKPNLIKQLGLYLDESKVLRCHGRLESSEITQEYGDPILLHPHAHVTKLLILDIHCKVMHFGLHYVLSEIRLKYWIPKGRQTVKGVLTKCVICKKVQGRSYGQPPHAPLPMERVTRSRPFSVTGLDYSGALFVRGDGGKILKVYIALFTCAVTRAIHLEIVEDCTEEEFLCAFRRFVSRRSVPNTIISDNAKTFEAANKTLHSIYEEFKVKNFLDERGITWKFIIKRAPWTGGFYERLIGLTKSALKKVLGCKCVSLKELRTIIVETEAVINDRPLTYVSGDKDVIEPITPSRMILGHNLTSLPTKIDEDILNDPSYQSENRFVKMYSRNLSVKLDAIWSRWKREYLSSLREYHRHYSGRSNREINVGEVVQIHEDMIPRMKWKLGIIVDVYKGPDGVVRSAQLRTKNGLTNRPVSKLYPLEIMANDVELEDNNVTSQSAPQAKPKRVAAIRALDLMKNSY